MENNYPGKDITPDDILERLPLVSKTNINHKSYVHVSTAVIFGGNNIPFIVGPNLVESEKLIFEVAEYAKSIGANMLRGGCFKPLTFPYRSSKYYETGELGLKWLKRAGIEFDLPTVTEAVSCEQVEQVAEFADMIQIGTRNMQNYPLLIKAARSGKPILLKRGFGASLRDWLAAAEYILYHGNDAVVLCERGIVAPHTHRATSRYLLDLQVVVAAKEICHLPVITDPSHATFWSNWVTPLAGASIVAGADGLMIETHPDPENAAVDPLQPLNATDLKKCFEVCKRVAVSLDRTIGAIN